VIGSLPRRIREDREDAKTAKHTYSLFFAVVVVFAGIVIGCRGSV